MLRKTVIGFGILGILFVYSLAIRRHTPTIPKPSSLTNTMASTTTLSGGSTPPPNNTSGSSNTTSQYKDGTYTGSTEDAFYGNVQVSVTISGGKLTTVNFLQYPNDRQTSVYINQQAMPYLQQEAIQAQSANVQIISGATFTSQAFIQSLQSALNQA